MDKRMKWVYILGMVVFFVIGVAIGGMITEGIMHNDFIESMESCEDQGQVLRVYEMSVGDVRVECFGNKPDIELHVAWE